MTAETLLVRGIAQALDDAGIGVWSTTVPYTAGQVGIYDGPIPEDLPDGIGLDTYPVADAVDSTSRIGLQVRLRSSNKATLRDRAEAVFEALHASWGSVYGTIRVGQLLRRSAADLGRHPETGAWERTDNYYADINRPTANRL